MEIPGLDATKTCICGAAVLDGLTLCRKCHSRERWERRQAKRRKADRRRGETRRPPARPGKASFRTVTS
ncbi:hypothetical protein J5X84_22170 [Streptosporangiaceae bacterium NEAU-GS5]|nr:hypothetical protein [Streptosporangiaceae bacterium NEAU-GS5]